MKTYLPLFVTSTARSGSYLVSMMLSANQNATVASEPYLELFRSMRNAFVRHNTSIDLQRAFDPALPMQDYYFTDERIRIMDAIQAGDVNIPFDSQEWQRFLEASVIRVKLQCAELVPYLGDLRGATYKEMFDNGFDIIAQVRRAMDRKWIGIKDAWTIEFFGPLARAYPSARFIIILRDPRAIINSMLGVVRTDPLQVAHVLSYARHWRKYVAFCTRYQSDPLFSNRLYVLTHEQVLREPERKARELCDFLEVEYDSAMLDADHYFDYATGDVWKGNSSFEEITSGISTHRAERWRTTLDAEVIRLIDFTCDPDMQLAGYEPVTDYANRMPDPGILAYVVQSGQEYCNWRSDLGDPQQDYGFELFRRALLTMGDYPLDRDLVRRSFLFEEVFDHLRQKNPKTRIV